MATIETAIRAMLTGASTLSEFSDNSITHGYRPQDGTLPAITFEVDRDERLTIGATPLRSASVELRVIASTTLSASGFRDDVQDAVVKGTYDTIVIEAVEWNGSRVEVGTAGEGDEAEPAELVCDFTVYYKE